jgi:arylsulfatase A-like enzyme
MLKLFDKKKYNVLSMIFGGATSLLIGSFFFLNNDTQTNKPNIVLIIIDTLRADALGVYNSRINSSPEIDQRARKGFVFTQAVSQSSWTRPSFGSFLTSQYSRTLGLSREDGPGSYFDSKGDSLPEVLKRSNYYTLGVTANPNINSYFGFSVGFDRYIDSEANFPSPLVKLLGNGPADSAAPFAPAVFSRVSELVDSIPKSSKQPVYIQVNIMDVHDHHHSVRPEFQTNFVGTTDSSYYQAVRQVSHDIEYFLDNLLSRPGWEDSLVVITSDHGEGLSDHPCHSDARRHGNILYRSNIHVPLVIFGKRVESLIKHQSQQLIGLIDLAPTILTLAGIKVPKSYVGVSLSKLMNLEADNFFKDRLIYSETYFRGVDKIAVVTSNSLLVSNNENSKENVPLELFDFWGVQHGACSSSYEIRKDEVKQLTDLLLDWDQRTKWGAKVDTKRERTQEEYRQLKSLGYLN